MAEGGMGYLSKTNLRPGVKLEGASAQTQPGTPQRMCQSISLGVALAAGLTMYCQYCDKWTEGPLVNLLQTLLPRMTKGRLHVKRTGEQLHPGSSGI